MVLPETLSSIVGNGVFWLQIAYLIGFLQLFRSNRAIPGIILFGTVWLFFAAVLKFAAPLPAGWLPTLQVNLIPLALFVSGLPLLANRLRRKQNRWQINASLPLA
ncbi:MAG: hypothetical protein Q4D82_04250, partial [Neisseria sp.]|nr:hypothetical protein [Neisseria sp.]